MFSGANGLHSKIINPPPTAEQADSPAVAPKNRKINFTPRPSGQPHRNRDWWIIGAGLGEKFWVETFWVGHPATGLLRGDFRFRLALPNRQIHCSVCVHRRYRSE